MNEFVASSTQGEVSQLPTPNSDTSSENSSQANEENILVRTNAMALELDTSTAASTFSSVAGVLGGFSITIVVLGLTPGMIVSVSGKDWIVALVLLSAGLYIYSAGIFANSIRFADTRTKYKVFNVALVLFHLSNLLLSLGVLILAFQFPLQITKVSATILSFFAFLVVLSNLGRKVLPLIGASILAGLATVLSSLFTGINSQ